MGFQQYNEAIHVRSSIHAKPFIAAMTSKGDASTRGKKTRLSKIITYYLIGRKVPIVVPSPESWQSSPLSTSTLRNSLCQKSELLVSSREAALGAWIQIQTIDTTTRPSGAITSLNKKASDSLVEVWIYQIIFTWRRQTNDWSKLKAVRAGFLSQNSVFYRPYTGINLPPLIQW